MPLIYLGVGVIVGAAIVFFFSLVMRESDKLEYQSSVDDINQTWKTEVKKYANDWRDAYNALDADWDKFCDAEIKKAIETRDKQWRGEKIETEEDIEKKKLIH